MWAMACSTLPVNTWGSSPARWDLASATAFSAAAMPPSPFSALMLTTSHPRASPSLPRSIVSPLFRTRSIMLTATTTGIPSSMSCVVRYRLRSMFVPSTMFRIASGFSPTR